MSKNVAHACAREGCDRPLPAPVPLPWGGTFEPIYCDEHAKLAYEEDQRAEEAARIATLVEASGIPISMREWGLSSYPLLDDHGQRAFRVATSWLDGYARGERENLYLHGAIGVGKTGLAVSIVRYLVETGTAALFVNWRDHLTATRESIGEGGAALTRPRKVPVLALDDLGAERPTEWAVEELAGLVQRRLDQRLPTIVTSNYTPDALTQRLGGGVIAERITDRLFDGAIVHHIGGNSRRRSYRKGD